MLANLSYFCITALLCCVIWQLLLGFFMVGEMKLYRKTLKKYFIFHYICICCYTIFAYYMVIKQGYEAIVLFDIVNAILPRDSIYIAICMLLCLVVLHVLSVLDFYIQKVPNILLVFLFVCSNVLYLLSHDFYDGYPFMILGIVYGIYFMLHVVGRRQYIGEGDVWIIACLTILLESFFAGEIGFIFELLCGASILGICYYYVMRLKRQDSGNINVVDSNAILQSNTIPFIPFLVISFFCVSAWHVA